MTSPRRIAGMYHSRLLCGSVITLTCAHVQLLVVLRLDLNGTVMTVGAEVGRLISQSVLAAQLFLDFGEGVGHVFNLEGKENAPAGGFGDVFQDLISMRNNASPLCPYLLHI